MLQAIKLFSLNTILSISIGLLVGFIVIIPMQPEEPPLELLLLSTLIGLVIGSISKFTVTILLPLVTKNLFWGYCAVFFIAGFLTLLSAHSLDSKNTLILLAIVEPLSLFTMFLNVKYFARLNKGLKRKQATLRQAALK